MNKWIRQFHRWLAGVFTVTVIFTAVGLAQEDPAPWVAYVPLLPLALMFFSGLYMFVVHYAAKWRTGGRPVRP